MKKYTFLFLSLGFASATNAQYFYKDIISNTQAKNELLNLKERKVKEVKITSYEDDGKPSKGFFCERKLSRDFKISEIFTKTAAHPPTVTTAEYSASGLLLRSTDSSEISTTRIQYTYDDDNRLFTIESTVRSADEDFVNVLKEKHVYQYNDDFYPDSMLRIMNDNDTTIILFSKDETGNISIEKDTRNGNMYYYYYDGKSRLTDIVHRTAFTDRLIPDYMFEYNSDGNISQMISTEDGGTYYFVWKYSYENNLRKKEDCYSKQRVLLGSIKYDYQ